MVGPEQSARDVGVVGHDWLVLFLGDTARIIVQEGKFDWLASCHIQVSRRGKNLRFWLPLDLDTHRLLDREPVEFCACLNDDLSTVDHVFCQTSGHD